jgi:hypothetical protein
LKQKEIEEVYQHKREILQELESLCEKQRIDLYYADESRVSLEPNVPYGWQFADEEVFMPTNKGNGLNCFALLSRTNQCLVKTGEQSFSSQFILELRWFNKSGEKTVFGRISKRCGKNTMKNLSKMP